MIYIFFRRRSPTLWRESNSAKTKSHVSTFSIAGRSLLSGTSCSNKHIMNVTLHRAKDK